MTVDGKVNASGSIKAFGNVRIEEKVAASGSVELRDDVYVGGKINSSGNMTLLNGVEVVEKVECSGSLKVDGNVKIGGKASSSGSIMFKNGVVVVGDVDTKGKMKIEMGTVRIGGKLSCPNGLVVDGEAVCEYVLNPLPILSNGIYFILIWMQNKCFNQERVDG